MVKLLYLLYKTDKQKYTKYLFFLKKRLDIYETDTIIELKNIQIRY